MQYPIIDNLIYAYKRNGWTGLELIESKNLLNPDVSSFIPSPGTPSRYLYQPNIIPANTLANMSFSDNDTSIDIRGIYFGFVEDFLPDGIPSDFRWVLSNGVIGNTKINTSAAHENVYCTSIFIYPNNAETINTLFQRYHIQVELGATPTPYEPYAPPTTDIKNRLKLPMIHYFPHPVVDALISAANGQHTEEEKEILRHYLTPLGIGGI